MTVAAPTPVDRWRLHRAGIVNVYQYVDETLHFGGGRLLLRGVNGSGKSTAMNMLLPFLIEADPRRIDAAGTQSRVLQSWMLSGRDIPQPVGYLWLEVARGDEHLTFGCGIRANRSSETVKTWWFVTDRRPGIDLALIEDKTPLSADALRTELGAHAVFNHDQRPAYRAELASRLFGGADLDQHLRLLHVVRSPLVGDRIATDLPDYLVGALPQLSDTAIDDAAQPLEDLEEYRRNVEHLSRTAAALDALHAVYANYARTELRRRADDLVASASTVASARRSEAAAVRRLEEARRTREAVNQRLVQLERDELRLTKEIEAIKEAPAYASGQQLDDLRKAVATLASALDDAHRAVGDAGKRLDEAAGNVRSESGTFATDLAAATADLGDLAALCASVGLPVRPPDLPAPRTESLFDDLDVPVGEFDLEPVSAGLAAVRAAVGNRIGDVDEVRATLATVTRRARDLEDLERRHRDALLAVDRATTAFDEARDALAAALGDWRSAVRSWWAEVVDHHAVASTTPADDAGRPEEPPDFDAALAERLVEAPDLVDRLDASADALAAAVTVLVDRHSALLASLRVEREAAAAEVDRLNAERDRLAALRHPDPPAASWQRPERGACFADLLDFADGLAPGEQAGLEAAMEAAGLLGAEVRPDGSLELASGDLVVTATGAVPEPLSRHLTVTVPEHLTGQIDTGALGRVLDSISTRPELLTGGAAPGDGGAPQVATVVTVDGRFRTGALHGRYTKLTAEHIGVTARRAALERQRAEIARLLADATGHLEAVDAAVERTDAHRRAALDLRAELPSRREVDDAHRGSLLAAERLDDARTLAGTRADEVKVADAAHAEASDHHRRTAATLALPADGAGLDHVADELARVTHGCDQVHQRLEMVARAHRAWADAARRWTTAHGESIHATAREAEVVAQHEAEAMHLASLEDAVGADYEELLAALDASRAQLEATAIATKGTRAEKDEVTQAIGRLETDAENARSQAERLDQACVALLPGFRAALAVPGLLEAARLDETGDSAEVADLDDEVTDSDDPAEVTGSDDAARSLTRPSGIELPSVTETPEGVRRLAEAVLAAVPAPERNDVTAEGVRQSLRQRRDTLGAGWDAEDHQPDERLPLRVEVTGTEGRMPLAQASVLVRNRLRDQSSLLTVKQDQALRNLLQGLIAKEVAEKLHAAGELVALMNRRLDTVSTSHGIGAKLRWRRRDDLDPSLAATIDLLSKPADLRTAEEDRELSAALSARIDDARRLDPDAPYRTLIAEVLDYRAWHQMTVMVRRPGRSDEKLSRRTALSEGEKKMVSYLPLFAAVAASCDALSEDAPDAPRFVLLDDAFAKVSEDNHASLFGLLVQLDLDFIATSERLWGTHSTVPELAITEVIRDAERGVIVLEHSRWDGHERTVDG